MDVYIKAFSEALDLIDASSITEVSNVELQLQIEILKDRYRAEMIAQNQKGSVARSYAAADRIRDQIRDLERKLR